MTEYESYYYVIATMGGGVIMSSMQNPREYYQHWHVPVFSTYSKAYKYLQTLK